MSTAGFEFAPSELDREFRDELRTFLGDHPPQPGAGSFEEGLEWQRTLHAGGWVAPHWPVDFGGRGATPSQYAIYWEELARAGAPQIANRIGLQTAGPTLLAHGSPAQQRRYLQPMLSGEEIWCQLFSEPEAGSDLGSLRTRAVLDGDTWVVTGQKVWTSFGAEASFGLLLARTEGSDLPGPRGISCFVCDLRADGVTARPIIQMTGDGEFSEVFLDEVVLPADPLVGRRGQGWAVAGAALSSERGVAFPMKEQMILQARLDGLVDRLHTESVTPELRRRVIDDVIAGRIFRLLNLRTLTMVDQGVDISSWASIIKLAWSLHAQHLSTTACDVEGFGGVAGDPDHWFELCRYRMASIAGGTSEIQRSIISERLLGMPR